MSALPGATGVEVPRIASGRFEAARPENAGIETTTLVDTESSINVTAHVWEVVDGRVFGRSRDGAGYLRELTGALLAEWRRGVSLTGSEWDEVAARVRTTLLDRQAAAQAAVPADQRVVDEAARARIAAARRAELEQQRADAERELAELDAGVTPAAQIAEVRRSGMFRRNTTP